MNLKDIKRAWWEKDGAIIGVVHTDDYMDRQQRLNKKAHKIRIASLIWCLLILDMAIVEPRLCGAMIGPVFLCNWWAHRVQFADVHEMLKRDRF